MTEEDLFQELVNAYLDPHMYQLCSGRWDIWLIFKQRFSVLAAMYAKLPENQEHIAAKARMRAWQIKNSPLNRALL